MQFLEAHIQTVTLLVLAFTAVAVFWQAIEGGKQAKASMRLAQLSLEQTELMRTQVHASFRPFVTVLDAGYIPNAAMLKLKNVGTGPALSVVGIYRSQARQEVGDLSPGQMIDFRFENSLNIVPRPVFPLGPGNQSVITAERTVPLRFEYQSASGADCWTTVDFPLGHEGAFAPDIEHGMDLPSLTTNL